MKRTILSMKNSEITKIFYLSIIKSIDLARVLRNEIICMRK